MPASSKALLVELLQVIVRNLGRETVLLELERLGDDNFQKTASAAGRPRAVQVGPRKPRLRKARSAVQQVELLGEARIGRDAFFLIATKYDQKKFLPTLSDVREFLAMRGGERRAVKDRWQGFALVLEILKEMTPGHLEDLANSDNFSGPLQLAPLSSAIKAAGEARRDKPSSDEPVREVGQSEGSAEDVKPDKA
jgi:hypothetical protein